jgi:acetate kinase
LNFVYAHLNRLIVERDLDAIFVTGPGHGGPGLVANAYLEGTYSEVYPHIGRDDVGIGRGLRRFGFHGLSHSWVARRAPELLDSGPMIGRLVSCHLGAGASLCAIADGRSQDTTMGFTPLEGLVMATRSGSVDPGMLLWLLEREAVSEREMAEALEHESGLAGLAGSADMQAVLAAAERNEPAAVLAIDVYLHHLRAGIAAMAAALGGINVLVFTGGVGEHSSAIRSRAADGLGFLGVRIDPAANAAPVGDAEITGGGLVRTLVLQAREDLEMARQTTAVLAASDTAE